MLSALVNGSFDRGARSINYDTGSGAGFASILAGMTLQVETAYGPEIVRVKSISGNQSSGTITLAENGIVWGNNDAIEISHQFEIWPVPPGILNGVFYRDFNVAFPGFPAAAPPVAISQGVLAGFLSAGSIQFTITLADSYAIANGATISSYSHSVVHNGGGTSGITIASAASASTTVTITTAGEYWHYGTVTDSNGNTQTIRSAIWVHDADNMPYIGFTLSPFTGDWISGQWRYSLTVTDGGDLTQVDIPDGVLCCLWQQNYFDGVEGYTNLYSTGNNILYAGYLAADSDNDNFDGGTGRADFTIVSPLEFLDTITDYGTISLEAKTSPTKWSDYASYLTVPRAVHALLKWDTTLLDVWPVYGLNSNSYGVKVVEFIEETVLQRINGVAYGRGIHAKLISDMRGKLRLVQDSQMLNDAARAALDTIFSITTADISGEINVTRRHTDIRAFADMDGFTYSHPTSTPFISMIPGYIEATVSYNLPEFRGTGVSTDKSQVLNPANGQLDCNERCGRRHALDNETTEIRFACSGNYVGAFEPTDPSLGWYEWGIANSALKRELGLNGLLMTCISCTHTPIYEGEVFTGLIHTSEVVLQPEAQGPPAIKGNYPLAYPAITTPDPFPPGCDLVFGSTGENFDPTGGDVAICALSSSQAVAIDYRDTYVLDISGEAITAGTVETLADNADNTTAIVALSSNQAIAIYRNSATSFATAVILDITGSTITQGTPAVFDNTGDCLGFGATFLSATKVLVTYREITGADIGRACILDISGSTITPGAKTEIRSGGLYASPDIIALTSSTLFCSYRLASGALYGRVLSVSGTTITPETEMTISANGTAGAVLGDYSNNEVIALFTDASALYATTVGVAGTSASANDETSLTIQATIGGIVQLEDEKTIAGFYSSTDTNAQARIVWCN